jgi:hypothetical protein
MHENVDTARGELTLFLCRLLQFISLVLSSMQVMFLTEPTPLETRILAVLSLLKHNLYLEYPEAETGAKLSLATLHSMV